MQASLVSFMMLMKLSLLVICASTLLFSQTTSSDKYQSGLILDVKEHQDSSAGKTDGSSGLNYNISIQVKDTVYVVSYTPPPGKYGFQYMAGMDLLVLVESKTITFNDMLGRSITVPILNQRPATPRNNR